MKISHKIVPCLWFDTQGEEAANFYVGIFKNSKITHMSRFGKEGYEIHRKPEGAVMTVVFELDGQTFTALNGGPDFKFNEAISLQVNCDSQQEIDYYWERLGAGGDPQAQQCGWLKDRYALSWQIVPKTLAAMLQEPGDSADRVMSALLQMKKLDLAALERAHRG